MLNMESEVSAEQNQEISATAPLCPVTTQTIIPLSPPPENEKTEKQPQIQSQGSALRQIVAAFVAQLGTINTGLAFGYTANAIPQLKGNPENGGLNITDDEGSWIASFSSIGTPIGCFISGYMMDTIGRQKTLIITEIPAILGWLLIAFAAQDIRMIYAGRFLVGLGSGMVGAPSRVYTGEVTQPHLRGTLTALASVGVSFGVLLAYGIGAKLNWNLAAGICTTVPLLSFLLIIFFPETPSYLVSRNKPEKARKALKRFRGSTCDLDGEMEVLFTFAQKTNIKKPSGFFEIINALRQPKTIKPFFILFLYFGIYQWSGTNAITFFARKVFKPFNFPLDDRLTTVLLGVVRLISTIVACVLCRRCGRRLLTLVSSVGCGLSMVGLGVWMWLTSDGKVSTATWFPVLCVFMYTILCTMGFLVIPWVMIGEVYPVQVRGIIGGCTTMSAHMFVFSVVRTFEPLVKLMTFHGIYLLYGLISLFGTIFFYFCLPETQGKSLQEIEDYFSGKNNNLKTGSIGFKGRVLEKGQVLS